MENINDFLNKQVGKELKIYKSGPECRTGTLLSVNGDFLILETEKDGIIYYNTQHIKSLSEDVSVVTSTLTTNNPTRPKDYYTKYIEFKSMDEVLSSMKYSVVRVDRGGPESGVGRLLGSGKDYFVIHTKEDGLLIYKTHHIKSINADNSANYKIEEYPTYPEGETFIDLLKNLQNKWVKINRGGPEKTEGVLTEVLDDYITVVLNKEVNRIATFHIRNIGLVENKGKEVSKEKEASKEKEENNETDEKKKENTNNENIKTSSKKQASKQSSSPKKNSTSQKTKTEKIKTNKDMKTINRDPITFSKKASKVKLPNKLNKGSELKKTSKVMYTNKLSKVWISNKVIARGKKITVK